MYKNYCIEILYANRTRPASIYPMLPIAMIVETASTSKID